MQLSWQRQSAADDLTDLLAPLRRRLWWRAGLGLVLGAAGLALGVLFLLALLALCGFGPAPGPSLALAAVSFVLLAALAALARPPSWLATARLVDRTAGLDDRVGTAVETLLVSRGAAAASPAAATQLADAAAHVRHLHPDDAVPVDAVRHQAILVGGLALLTAGLVLLAGLGDGVPGGLIPLRQTLESALAALRPAGEEARSSAPARNEVDARVAPLLQQLDALRTDEAGLSAEELAARRAAAAQQLAELAARSRAQQEALSELARALQASAAAHEAAERLTEGDYARAAAALEALGRESDQLSPAGRRQLADALRQASTALRQLSPELADRAGRAAQALTSRDYRRTEQALEALAEAVAQAGQNVVPQGDLGMLGEALADQGADLEAALAALEALGLRGGAGADGRNPNAASGGPPGSMPGGRPQNTAGGLGAAGAPVPLDSLPSLDGAPGSDAPDPERPSVLAPSSIGATASAGPVAGGEAFQAAGETAPVPTERREVVRGYFGGER